MKVMIISAVLGVLFLNGAMADEQRTDIHHSDGTTSTVRTDRSGTQVITPGHGGGQFGRDIPHEDVVKQYTRPDSQVEHR